MKFASPLHFKTYVLILFIVVFGPLGNLLLGKGMKDVAALASGNQGQVARVVFLVLRSEYVWLGIGSLLVFFIAYSLVLSWADYSYVQPTSAFAYGTSALLGHFVLGEVVSPLQWAGVTVIALGVFIVGRTSPSSMEKL